MGSQDALVAAFGLGGRTRVDSLVVHWPSGIYQYLPPITLVDRAITLTEPPLALAVGEGAAVRLRCAPATPNPFRAATHVAYQLPRAAQVRATVHDVQGRLLATLTQGAQSAGTHDLLWRGATRRAGACAMASISCDSTSGMRAGMPCTRRNWSSRVEAR
jgi:hypothetical protein